MWEAVCAYSTGDLVWNASEIHLCGRELVFRRPGSGLQCVELHGRVSGESIGLHAVRIRCSMARKLICGVEGEAANLTPVSLFSAIFHSASYPWLGLCDRWTWIDGISIAEREKKEEGRTGSVASQSYLRDLLSMWAYVHLLHLAHRCPDYYSGDQDLHITAWTLDLRTWQSVLLAENMQIGSISAQL